MFLEIFMIPVTIAFVKANANAVYENSVSGYVDVKPTYVLNESIVVAQIKAVSLQQCLSFAFEKGQLQTKSQYFDKANQICYMNSDIHVSVAPENTDDNVTIYYCEFRKLMYIAKKSVDSERVIIVGGRTYFSCSDAFNDGFRETGIYKIKDPRSAKNFIEVLCDGGWTVFQRRDGGGINFDRNWNEYVAGFGNKVGEFWLGLETIHHFTTQGQCELYIELNADGDNAVQTKRHAMYTSFRVEGAGTNYKLHVSGFRGNVVDSLSHHSGHQFSTMDSDHDGSTHNCAEAYKAGWWYTDCYTCNLNGRYMYGQQGHSDDGIVWSQPWSQHESLVKVVMKFRCK